MNGIGVRSQPGLFVHDLPSTEWARRGAGRVARRIGAAFEALDRDREARDAVLAGDRRRRTLLDRLDEGHQLGAQRLGVADREMAHRIAAVGLEAVALGDLAGEQVADHVFALGGDVHGARLERRQPVGVDVGEHAGGGAELQERDVLALGDRVGELRLHLLDLGPGEPADQVDVVDREIDHHADIRHARRERTDPGDRDRQDVLVADRFPDRLDRRIEALDMPDHQGDAGAARRIDDVLALGDGGGDRLLDENVHAALDAGERDGAMEVRRCRDRHRIDAAVEQFLDGAHRRASERGADEGGLLAVGIAHAGEADAGHFREHARMVRTHDANTNDADPQVRARVAFRGMQHGEAPSTH